MVPPERLRDAHADFEVVGHGEAAILEELPGDLESDHELRFRLLDVRAQRVTVRHRERPEPAESRELAPLLRAERVARELVQRQRELLV